MNNRILAFAALMVGLTVSTDASAYQFLQCSLLVEGRTPGTLVSMGGVEFSIINEEDEKPENQREYTFAAHTLKSKNQTYEPRSVLVVESIQDGVTTLKPKTAGAVLETIQFKAGRVSVMTDLFKSVYTEDAAKRPLNELNARLLKDDGKTVLANFTCHRTN